MLSSTSSVLFATFSLWSSGQRMPTNGNLEPLRDYLVPRVRRLVLIDQPHPGSDRTMPTIEEYVSRAQKPNRFHSSRWLYLIEWLLVVTNSNKTNLFFKVRDFLSVTDWVLRDKSRYNYFVGMESINTLAGIVLKKIGLVDEVIYYVLDYSPNRFSPLLNKAYLALDRWCLTHSDYVWDVSRAIQPARIIMGLDNSKCAPVIHVPIGIYPGQLMNAPVKRRWPKSLCYMGTLTYEQGPDLAVKAMPLILKRYPGAKLHIVGGGQENLNRLKKLTSDLRLTKSVKFYGFVPKNDDMASILSRCMVGVAPYRNIPGSIRQYADASKLRSYAAAALPIVTTQVPPLGTELSLTGGAVIVPDTPKNVADAVMKLFSDRLVYDKMREALINFARENTWENEFDKAFAKSQREREV